jgi:hypothetical protein
MQAIFFTKLALSRISEVFICVFKEELLAKEKRIYSETR